LKDNKNKRGVFVEGIIVEICTKKVNREVDLSWEQIAEIYGYANGEVLRQKFKAYRKKNGTLPSMKDHRIEEVENKIEEVDKKTLEMRKEKIKLQREKLDIQRWLRNQAKFELLIERMENAIDGLEPLESPRYMWSDGQDKTAIVGLADIHYGKRILLKDLDGEVMNKYDSEIFERRMWELSSEIVRISRKESLKEVHIVNLADTIDGLIHIGQLQNAEFGVIDSIIKFSNFMATWLNTLSQDVKINYHATLGNHPEIRPLHTKAGELDKENLEKIIHEFLRIRLENNKNVKISECNKMSFMNIFGLNILSVHGQLEKGNLEQSIKDYMIMYKKPINLLLAGHLHTNHSKSVGSGMDFVQFSSICGMDDFSIKIHKASGAGTKMLILEKGRGKTIDYNIDLQHII